MTMWKPLPWALVQALAALLVVQLPPYVPGRAAEDGSSSWAPAPEQETHVEFQALIFDLV